MLRDWWKQTMDREPTPNEEFLVVLLLTCGIYWVCTLCTGGH